MMLAVGPSQQRDNYPREKVFEANAGLLKPV